MKSFFRSTLHQLRTLNRLARLFLLAIFLDGLLFSGWSMPPRPLPCWSAPPGQPGGCLPVGSAIFFRPEAMGKQIDHGPGGS